MACEPRLGLRVLAADVAREPGLVYDAVDVTRPPPARFSWRALYAATAAAAAAADERSGAGRALEPGDFSFEREVGVGAFGQVVLATHKKTGTRYAVKTISKKVLRRKKIAQRIWRLERDVLVRIEPHPYIVPLLGSFQTLSHFFLVMAYLPGGELFETLRERGAFSEEISSFYAAEVTLALEHLHASGVIHRDLKPENLLLDDRAHCVVPGRAETARPRRGPGAGCRGHRAPLGGTAEPTPPEHPTWRRSGALRSGLRRHAAEVAAATARFGTRRS